jgi:ABC-type antimicrobial peptide transport system permease subunit
VREVESGIPLEGLGLGAHTLVDRLADRLAPRRHDATVVASFALVALVLALIGVYGVTSYTVVSEAREIGIRLALGARPRGVSRLMVARTIRLVVAGLAVGLVAGLLLTRFMGSVLFDVPPNDPETFLIVAAALLTVASLAGYLPARRAASIDPVSTLKG